MFKSKRGVFFLALLLLVPELALTQKTSQGAQKKGSSAPVISSLSPASVTAGGPAFTLTVNGTNFATGAVVLWNGASQTTTVVSSTQVRAAVTSMLIAAAGTASISVYVPGRSGGTSNILYLTIGASTTTTTTTTTSPLAITTLSIPAGTVGTAYSAALGATGGTSPYSWSAGTGVPPGLALASTGALSGTPTTSGNYSFSATVKDSAAGSASYTYAVSIGASTTTSSVPNILTTSPLPSGSQGTAYSATLAASGGTAPYTWSVSSGSLPAGVSLGASTGALSGTPTASGSFSFIAKCTDTAGSAYTKSFALSIGASTAPVSISTTSVPGGTQGTAYSSTLAATGGTTPYSWSISSGALPGGITLASSTGALSGTPTASGSFSFTAQVKDASANVASMTYAMSVAASTTTTSTLAAAAVVPPGIINNAYTNSLASGGTGPYSFTLTSGSLPPGIAFNTATGQLSGLPTAAGTAAFAGTIKDSTGASISTAALTLPIQASPIQVDGGFESGTFTNMWSAFNDATHTTIAYQPAGPTSTVAPFVHSGTRSLQLHFYMCGIPNPPTLSYTPGGSLPQTTYYVKQTGYSSGETTPSTEVNITVPAGNLLVVTLSPAQPTLTGANLYVGMGSGAEQLQNSTPLVQGSVWVEPASGLVAGVAPPTTFTAACPPAAQDQNFNVAFQPGKWDGYPSGVNPVYVRAYFYLKHPEPDGTADGVQRKLIYLMDSPSPTWSVVLDAFSAGGTNPLAVAWLQGGGTGPQQLPYLGYSLSYDAWHEVEIGLTANTPGLSDGIITVWVDGAQIWQQTGVNMRGSRTTGIGYVMVGDQTNRYAYAPINEYRYVDDVVIDNKYIP